MGFVCRQIHISGMTCINCQHKIEGKLRHTAGIKKAIVNYNKGIAEITYDTELISWNDIVSMIENLGYTVLTNQKGSQTSISHIVSLIIIIISLYMILQQFGILNLLVPSQLADTKMGYGMLFLIGLITSVHCVAMCGGINLTQCIPNQSAFEENNRRLSAFRPAFLYNLGRVISYTVMGFLLGFAGMLIGGGTGVGLPTLIQGILKLAAGLFMVIMGINMLGIFPWLRKFNLRLPKLLTVKIGKQKGKSKRPLVVGLLNGLMPCGPLQSMQIVALAAGTPLVGALSMFLFSLGTVPLMLGLGSIVSALGRKFTQKVMCVGAVLVIVLGLAMLSQGGSLSGLLLPKYLLILVIALSILGVVASIPFHKTWSKAVILATVTAFMIAGGITWNRIVEINRLNEAVLAANKVEIENGVQVVNSTLESGSYPDITVQVGVPVKWVIDAPKGSINGCNYKILLKEYGIEYIFQDGENIIEFTPTKAGSYGYTCWMGMIHGNIYVTDGNGETTTITPEPVYNGYGIGDSCCGGGVSSKNDEIDGSCCGEGASSDSDGSGNFCCGE